MRLLLVVSLLFICLRAEAYTKPLQAMCEIEAEILSIAGGKFYWGEGEFYRYFDIGILAKGIAPLERSEELLVCSPLKEKERTDIVRVWVWNNEEEAAWVYEGDGPKRIMSVHDKVKLKLTRSFVGEGSWPTIIGAELIKE